MTPLPLGRIVASALLAVGLVAVAARPGLGDTPPGANDKEIAALEKQLSELQAKLKVLKETPAPKTLTAAEEILPEAWVNQFNWRCIGPATMGGRITSISVCPGDCSTYWIATASGGLLKTTNNGISFEHQFDREATVSIGAVAVAPSNKEIVYVGTGEANPRNSVSWGDGVYKSTDGGKSWKNVGLKGSFQIGDVVVHPTNPDVVYVGALGRLYGPGGDRGLYKTEDGGKTWKNILPNVDDKTGVIDIAMNPADPNLLVVATWERQRDEFDSFLGDSKPKAPGGADEYAPVKVHAPGSALYKTTDGGKTFTKLTKGLPTVKLGRIGLDWSRKSPKTVWAIIDTEKAGMGKAPTAAYLGVQSETDAAAGGVKITGFSGTTPAVTAGLKENDVILAIAAAPTKTYEAMIEELGKFKPTDKAKFKVLRGKDTQEIEVTFGARPEAKEERPNVGLTADDADGGVLVATVAELGPAAKGGLKAGDLITGLDGKPVATRRDMLQVITGKRVGDKLKVDYTRGMAKNTVELTLELAAGTTQTRPNGGGQLGGQLPNRQNQQGPDGFETGGVYKSTDAGDTWTRVNSYNPRPFYFSLIRVDPTDDNTIYVGGVKLSRSTDGGKSFSQTGINAGVHDDHHDMWIDPKDGRHIIAGTDGGFYVTYDRGARWDHMQHAGAIGQFYHVAVDNQTPYRVYGGLQDNGSWGGPSRSPIFAGPLNTDWLTVKWGDGFVCRVDPTDPNTVYAESQDGAMSRLNLRTGGSVSVRPRARQGLGAYRFNWNTPFILSAHNPNIFYSAGNYVFRSVKRGDDSVAVSPEITLTKRGSATALSESPKNPDVLWVGTDDGAVWVTKDGCKTWTNVTPNFKAAGLPGPRWVASIEASKWTRNDGRAYVVFDGHRSNDDEPYVFVTDDFGATWASLKANLPKGSTRVLREDIANPNLLYLGTEFAAYASVNSGMAWTKSNGNKPATPEVAGGLPTVAVHEFAQPTTANDLVVATHGRSIWVLDVTALRQLTSEVVRGKTALLAPSPAIQWRAPNRPPFSESVRAYAGQNPSRAANLDYVIGKKATKAELKVQDVTGNTLRTFEAKTEPGYYRVTWDFGRPGAGGGRFGGQGQGGERGRFGGQGRPEGKGATPPGKGPNPEAKGPVTPSELAPALNPLNRPGSSFRSGPGTYRVVLTVDGTDYIQTLTVERDPTVPLDAATPEPDGVEEERQLEKLLKLRPVGGTED